MPSTRDALITAATDLLRSGGPAAVTLRDVGRLAGVSHNAPYKHFVDKEGLLAAVAARSLARQGRAMSRAIAGRTAGAALEAAAVGYVRAARRDPAVFHLVYGPWVTDQADLGEAAGSTRSRFVDLVAAAQGEQAMRGDDPERLASLIHAVAHGAVELELGGHLSRRGKGGADAEDLVRDLLATLASPERHPRPARKSSPSPRS